LSASSRETKRILEAPPGAPAEVRPSTSVELLEKLEHYAKWLRPGMRVKRWLIVALLGIAILVAGVDLMFLLQLADLGDQLNALFYRATGKLIVDTTPFKAFTYQALLGIPTATLGLLIFLYGVRCMLGSVTSAVAPPGEQSIPDVIWRRRQLAQGARIVVIGGGTGLSTMLRGLKEYTSNITAIVTVTDDGGSSGRLQREFGMLPPGDIRNCLVALADAEPLMQQLFQYRFGKQGEQSGLMDHSFGNLLIAAMVNITDDFEEAVRQTSRVLAIRGRVLPSTTRSTVLIAEMEDGTIVEGETSITKAGKKIKSLRLSEEDVEPIEEALEAIRTADAIVIGPGSVFTSVLPNFLVRGVAEAVAASPALKMYVCNVMTQPGESDGFTAGDHVRTILQHAGKPIIDYALINTEEPSAEMKQRYGGVGAEWVRPDPEEIRRLGVRPVTGRFISQQSVVRHDQELLAEQIVRLTGRRTSPLFWFLDQRA
jgi:uncharacterized cofD-like protein